MAVQGDLKFGLNVNRNLADVVNSTESLANIGVDIKDLDVIRNAAGTLGITSDDVRALSGLNVSLQTYLTKLYTDTQQYASIIEQTAGTTEPLKGNLTINGQLGASSIKYQYIDNEDDITLKYADISTSRISSWSSPDSPNSTEISPIFYGGAVEIDGPVITGEIELLEPAIEVRFRDSEVPTHKIEVEVNGSTIYFYAMKGIPLVFKGFFRNFNSDLRLNSAGAVSWRVVNNTASYLTREYENVGGSNTTRSYLRYRDTRASSKDIEIYHNPNNIRTLPLNAVGLEKLPLASLEGLQYLYIYRNLLKTMPDFTVFSPNLLLLDIRENNLTLSADADLRSFNQAVVDRIPKSVTEIRFGNTFNGSITGNLRPDTITDGNLILGRQYTVISINDGQGGADSNFVNVGAGSSALYQIFTATGTDAGGTGTVADMTTGLPKLVTMNLNSHSRGGPRTFFGRDSLDPDGNLPEVHITCKNYYAYRNAFDTLPESIMALPNLRIINIYANSISQGNFRIDSDDIDYVNIGNNQSINNPNLTGKEKIRNFYNHYSRGEGLDDNGLLYTQAGDYKFTNCSSLQRIYCYSNRFYGPVSKFSGNNALYQFESRYSRITGGRLITANQMEDGKEYYIWFNPELQTDDIILNQYYEIVANDDFDFTTLGALNNNIGTTFEATSITASVAAIARVRLDFTSVGATSSVKYSAFTADLTNNFINNSFAKVVDKEYVLFDDLFDDCKDTMQYFRMSSSSLFNAPLHPDLFSKTYNMRGMEIRSFNRGISGNIPSLASMQRLRYLVFLQNNFTGPVPSLFNNPSVYYIHLYQNLLTGSVPQIESTELRYLYLHSNQLSGFNGLNCPNILRVFISYNQLTGNVPDMNNLEKCYDLYLNNNLFSGYTPGAIVGMRGLRRFDLSNNPTLTGQSVNDIISDAVLNYENNPRGGVSINLANTATVTGEAVEQLEFLRAAGWNIRN
jgi:hypothetical protein